MRGFPRYDTPYGRVEFPAREIAIAHAGHALRLRFDEGLRESSGSMPLDGEPIA